jgi:hypothetical protein
MQTLQSTEEKVTNTAFRDVFDTTRSIENCEPGSSVSIVSGYGLVERTIEV